MKCDNCHENEATVHLTEVINGEVTKLHLCEKCAKKKGEEMQTHFGLTDLLTGLMDLGPTVTEEKIHEDMVTKCAGCGMTYYDFQKGGKLGCSECYKTFQEDLSLLLRKIHGSDRHAGKMPTGIPEDEKNTDEIRRLKSELQELVMLEDFEKAAIIRDRLRSREKHEEKGS